MAASEPIGAALRRADGSLSDPVGRRRPEGSWAIARLVNLRHLLERPRRTLLTLAGLAASVCLLITISAINSTLSRSIADEARGLAGQAPAEVTPMGTGGLGESAARFVGESSGVGAAVPFTQELVRMRSPATSTRSIVFGVPANFASLFPGGLGTIERQLQARDFLAGDLILTQALAQALGAHVGASISVETPAGYQRLRVGALLARGPFAAVNGGQFALMSLGPAQSAFERTSIDGIYVAARPGWSPTALRNSLRRHLKGSATVQAPGSEARAYEHTFDSIAAISQESRIVGLAVAFFLVLNTMSMSLAERREEIALLLVGGATRVQILTAVLLEAALLGLLGSILGILGGAALADALLQRAVASYDILPITSAGYLVLRPLDVLLGLIGGLAVTLLGAALPARHILDATPIDALRPEAGYEWSRRQRARLPRGILFLGVAAILASALSTWLAPLGSSGLLAGLVLAISLVGTTLTLPWLAPALARGVARGLERTAGPIGRLAGRGLLRSPGRTTIAAGGLAVAGSFVIAIGSGVGSYQTETERAAWAWYAAPLYVSAAGSAAYISDQPLPSSFAQQLRAVGGVKAAYPMRFGLIDSRGQQLLIYAMPIAEAAHAGHRITGSFGISQARLVDALGRGEAVISRLTARHRHLKLGESLLIPTLYGTLKLRIGGLFDDIASFDSMFVEHSLYEFLSGDATADRFAVVLDPGVKVASAAAGLKRYVEASGIPASVFTRTQMASYLVDSIASLFSIAHGIELAALLVAALIALATMLTATFERRREFAIQRILGMSSRQLGLTVILEALAVSTVGAIVAVALGLGLGFLMTFSIENQLAWRIAFHPSPSLVLGTVAAMILLGAAAALYPSWLASRGWIIGLLEQE